MLELPAGVRRVTRGRRTYWYYHQGRGSKRAKRAVALPGDPTDPAFWQTLRDFTGLALVEEGTFVHLIDLYRKSPEWGFLRPMTRKGYAVYLRGFERAWGELHVASLTIAGIYAHRDGMAKTPVAANQMLPRASIRMIQFPRAHPMPAPRAARKNPAQVCHATGGEFIGEYSFV